jgi:transposase
MPRRWWIGSTWPSCSTRRWTGSGGKITRAYKATLSKAERKAFRSRMWEFRRNPKDLSAEETAKLERLFEVLPQLRTLYDLRVRFQQIFDTAVDRREGYQSLVRLFFDVLEHFPAMDRFIRTFEAWEAEILNYFEERQTSGPVEGINNKARVIVKRAYGLKAAGSLWTRLVLDLNRSNDVVRHTIEQLRGLVAGFRAAFACT